MLEDPLLAFLLPAKENISKCLAGAQRLMLKRSGVCVPNLNVGW